MEEVVAQLTSSSLARPIAVACASITLTILVRNITHIWRHGCGSCCTHDHTPLSHTPTLSAADLAAVARDADLDAVIDELSKLHAEADEIDERMRRQVTATGHDYEAWSSQQHLASREERLAHSKLGALLALREERRSAAALKGVGGGSSTAKGSNGNSATEQHGEQRGSVPPSKSQHAEAARLAAAFNSSEYTRAWRERRPARDRAR